MAKVIVWKDVLDEAAELGQSMFAYIADNCSLAGRSVVDENGEKVTQARWANALGMSTSSLGRYLRRSEHVNPPAHNTTGRAIRGARQTLRDPELARKVLADPKMRRAVEDALYAQPEVDGSRDVIRNTVDSTHEADRILGPLGHIHSVLWREARKIATVQQPRKVERDELLLAADELRMYADTFESFGKSSLDSADFAEWVAERQEER